MIKDVIDLDGTWDFSHATDGRSAKPVESRQIQVPGPWQAQFPDLRMKAGMGLYRRAVDLPPGWRQGQILLKFGAVFHETHAWVNGMPVGDHRGGFLPFTFDITHAVIDGRNDIFVQVLSPTDDPNAYPDTPFTDMPFGKQSWYGPQSGIWQSVRLERRDPDHITGCRITADFWSGKVVLVVSLARLAPQPLALRVLIRDPVGRAIATHRLAVAAGEMTVRLDSMAHSVMPWSPDMPNLYRVELALERDGEVIDELMDTFGFRSFEAREGRFYLNGQPLYLRAALDQDYYPDTLCTTPSVAFLEDQFRKARELGLNCLRLHIKVPDPRYYEVADRIGMLVWSELPNGGRLSARARARAEETLRGIVDRDGNHPSIICWTIINENWGTDLVHNAKHRAWLKQTYSWLKEYDPTRLVVDNSPLAPSMHVQTDIADFHFYAAIPDRRGEWDRFVESLASRPAWLFSAEGDAIITGKEPLMCSEFGNWGLPNPVSLRDQTGQEPWWFETGHDWGDGVMYPHGIENRFADWSLDQIFGSLRGFIEAAQWQQFRALKYEIESMRRQPNLAGYVITELTDCHWESNGLLDMRRNPRIFHALFRATNADTVIVPRVDRFSYWSHEQLRIGIHVAHGAGPPLQGARLSVAGGDRAGLSVPDLQAGHVADCGEVTMTLPDVSFARIERITLELRAASGLLIASNYLEIALHPRRAGANPALGTVWSTEPSVRDRLNALGYRLALDMDSAGLVIALEPEQALTAYVQSGGRLLFLAEEPCKLYPFFPHWQNVRVLARDDTIWRGDWASSFAWLRRTGRFQTLPGEALLDNTFDRVIPEHVIAGCNLLDFQGRVHAGLVVGWVHKPVALAVERGYGEGSILASTFRLLRDPPGEDPTATVLLDRFIGLTAGIAEPVVTPEKLLTPADS
ncbi:MAG TPA: glycoside hydrolase family 2 TIM barrel-domain containing protein [Dongiaceae bacterium]|jgi:hypothetical protein|nr:glycoside hydrolase family 2 TIM barrel-domain containing protein [Dongiaceae bacterium]